MNTAYKHLDARVRIAELTLGQWAIVLFGLVVAFLWFQLSPLSESVTFFMAIYIGALPGVAAVVSTYTEFDAVLFARSALRWWRRDGRMIAGSGQRARGYVIHDDVAAVAEARNHVVVDPGELRRLLWDA